MAPPKLTPDKTTLQQWLAEGLTHQEMADRVFDTTGNRVTRSAISVAMMAYGLTTPKARYINEVPWRVRADHAKSYPVKMLRLLGRRNAGTDLYPGDDELLDSWLRKMDNENLIVAYDPDSDAGFAYIDAQHKDHDGDQPIRIKTIHLKEEMSD